MNILDRKNKHKYWDVPEWQAKIHKEDQHGMNCLVLILLLIVLSGLVERLILS